MTFHYRKQGSSSWESCSEPVQSGNWWHSADWTEGNYNYEITVKVAGITQATYIEPQTKPSVTSVPTTLPPSAFNPCIPTSPGLGVHGILS